MHGCSWKNGTRGLRFRGEAATWTNPGDDLFERTFEGALRLLSRAQPGQWVSFTIDGKADWSETMPDLLPLEERLNDPLSFHEGPEVLAARMRAAKVEISEWEDRNVKPVLASIAMDTEELYPGFRFPNPDRAAFLEGQIQLNRRRLASLDQDLHVKRLQLGELSRAQAGCRYIWDGVSRWAT
jgi:hypothetical protein